jgi:hypothetical protein
MESRRRRLADGPREGDARWHRDCDEVFDHDGRHILLVDGSAARLVDGLVLDVVDAEQGQLGLREGSRPWPRDWHES